jgi:hypothetical protein
MFHPRKQRNTHRSTRQYEQHGEQRQFPPAMRTLKAAQRGIGQGAAQAAKGVFEVQHGGNPFSHGAIAACRQSVRTWSRVARVARNSLPSIILTMQLNFKILCFARNDDVVFCVIRATRNEV